MFPHSKHNSFMAGMKVIIIGTLLTNLVMCEKKLQTATQHVNANHHRFIFNQSMIDGTLALHGGCHGDKTSLPTIELYT